MSFSGLEIEGDFIKFAQAQDSAKGRKIIKLIVKKLPSPSAQDKVCALKELVAQAGLLTVCIPHHKVAVRFLRFPTTDEKEISAMVRLQSTKELPFLKEDIISDYLITEYTQDGYAKIALVIVHQEVINGYLDILKKAGLQPQNITFSAEATNRWLHLALGKRRLQGGVLLVDVDSENTDFAIFYDSCLNFTRAVSFGTAQLARQPDLKNKLAEELKRTIDGYHRQEKARTITRIMLVHTGAITEGLKSYLAQELNLPCETVSAQKNLSLQAETLPVLQQAEVSLVRVLGAVLETRGKKLNLLPPVLRQKQELAAKKRTLLRTALILLGVIILVFLILGKKLHDLRLRMFYLDREITRTQPLASDVEKMLEKIELIKERNQLSGSSIDVLRQLYLLAPRNISLANLTYDEEEGSVKLQGASTNRPEIYQFLEALEKTAYFKNVQLKYVNEKSSMAGSGVDFKIECTLER